MAKMDWHRFLKRYVWDDEKTPYLVAVHKLNRKQADYELFAYVLFMSVLFAVLGIIFSSAKSTLGQSFAATFYCFSVACSAIALHITKELYTAIYCGLAPAAIAGYLLLAGGHPNLHAIDAVFIVIVVVLWLRYSWRIFLMVKAYPMMPEPPDGK